MGIIAGFERKGRWTVGRTFRGLAVIGNGEIDLRQARFIDGETTIQATAIIGSITVVVPEDADVHIGGTGVVGGFDHHDEGPGTPGAPRITINGFVFCGSVAIERRPAQAETASPRLKRAQRGLSASRDQADARSTISLLRRDMDGLMDAPGDLVIQGREPRGRSARIGLRIVVVNASFDHGGRGRVVEAGTATSSGTRRGGRTAR